MRKVTTGELAQRLRKAVPGQLKENPERLPLGVLAFCASSGKGLRAGAHGTLRPLQVPDCGGRDEVPGDRAAEAATAAVRSNVGYVRCMIQITSAIISRMPTIVQMRPLFMFDHPARVRCDGIRSGVIATV